MKSAIQSHVIQGTSTLSIAAGASVEIRNSSDGLLAQLWIDRDGITGETNPFTTDAEGFFRVFADPGVYDIIASDGVDIRRWNFVVALATLPSGGQISSTLPQPLGIASAGTSNEVSASDHVHEHGNQAGGTLHSVATELDAGFFSATDKANHNRLTGQVNVDDLHSHSHGIQSGGNEHTIATTSAAGFFSTTDRTNMNTLTGGGDASALHNHGTASSEKHELVMMRGGSGQSVDEGRPATQLSLGLAATTHNLTGVVTVGVDAVDIASSIDFWEASYMVPGRFTDFAGAPVPVGHDIQVKVWLELSGVLVNGSESYFSIASSNQNLIDYATLTSEVFDLPPASTESLIIMAQILNATLADSRFITEVIVLKVKAIHTS